MSHFSFELFEVAVGFGARDGVEYPVMIVPEGVRYPVASKADFADDTGRKLIRFGDVYCRTLGSNGTVSTAVAGPADWRDIMEICFENREADVGRFLRRLVGESDVEALFARLSGMPAAKTPPTLRDRAEALQTAGEARYLSALARRRLSEAEKRRLDLGTWSVALAVDPPQPDARADQSFLQTVAAANPNYTGWPVWLDSRGFVDAESRPENFDMGWEALIISLEGWSHHVEFMRFEPRGEFYLHRLLEDDLTDRVGPGTALDAILAVLRTAEAIAVGLSIVANLGWSTDETKLGFHFRWTKLRGRELSSWANPLVGICPTI